MLRQGVSSTENMKNKYTHKYLFMTHKKRNSLIRYTDLLFIYNSQILCFAAASSHKFTVDYLLT